MTSLFRRRPANLTYPWLNCCVTSFLCRYPFNPWLTPEVKTEMIVKDQLYRKVREHNKKGDWELYKAVKSSCNNIVKSAKKCYNGNLLTKHKNNPRTFWKIIKSNFPESKAKAVQLSVTFSSENDQNNDLNMANSFCEHFSHIGTCLKEKSLSLCTL